MHASQEPMVAVNVSYTHDSANVKNRRGKALAATLVRQRRHERIGGTVGGLSTVACDGNGRGEENKEIQCDRVTTENLVQVDGSAELRPQDLGHLLKRHLGK